MATFYVKKVVCAFRYVKVLQKSTDTPVSMAFDIQDGWDLHLPYSVHRQGVHRQVVCMQFQLCFTTEHDLLIISVIKEIKTTI